MRKIICKCVLTLNTYRNLQISCRRSHKERSDNDMELLKLFCLFVFLETRRLENVWLLHLQQRICVCVGKSCTNIDCVGWRNTSKEMRSSCIALHSRNSNLFSVYTILNKDWTAFLMAKLQHVVQTMKLIVESLNLGFKGALPYYWTLSAHEALERMQKSILKSCEL